MVVVRKETGTTWHWAGIGSGNHNSKHELITNTVLMKTMMILIIIMTLMIIIVLYSNTNNINNVDGGALDRKGLSRLLPLQASVASSRFGRSARFPKLLPRSVRTRHAARGVLHHNIIYYSII